MSEWISELTKGLADEFGDQPWICTLATVDKNGSPRARSVVCRKIGSDGGIWIASDARSEKNEQIKATPQAEVCFWLSGRREQFRVGGSVKLWDTAHDDPGRNELWKAISDTTRAMFYWPTPGAKRIDPPEAFAAKVDAGKGPPPSFEVIMLRPRRVEQLQLTPHPHRRRRWMLAGNWSAGSEVNP